MEVSAAEQVNRSKTLIIDACSGAIMAFPIKKCVVCGEEFELRPGKPGFANRCPDCSEPDAESAGGQGSLKADDPDLNAERRKAMRDMLYRKDS